MASIALQIVCVQPESKRKLAAYQLLNQSQSKEIDFVSFILAYTRIGTSAQNTQLYLNVTNDSINIHFHAKIISNQRRSNRKKQYLSFEFDTIQLTRAKTQSNLKNRFYYAKIPQTISCEIHLTFDQIKRITIIYFFVYDETQRRRRKNMVGSGSSCE